MKRDRDLERWLLGEGGLERTAQVRERARHDEAVRNIYDDYFAVLRALERGEGDAKESTSAPAELALEQKHSPSAEELRWLTSDFFDTWQTHAAQSWFERLRSRVRWPHVLAPAAVLSGAVLASWIGFFGTAADGDSRLVARGRGRHAELELELFCGNPPAQVNAGRCSLAQSLTFAVRATRADDDRVLTVFGISANGDVKYYAPTPVDGHGVHVAGDHWQAVDFSVQLDVNHQPGSVDVFAILAPRAARLEEVNAWAANLAAERAPADADSWFVHLEKSNASLFDDLCPDADACDAVQTQLSLDPSGERR